MAGFVVAFASFVTASTCLSAAVDAVLYRIFLKDGTTVVSYGEYVKLNDRLVFSMPLGPVTEDPKLQLVSLPVATVDLGRTEEYAQSARQAQFVATRAESEFTLMTSQVAAALNKIGLTPDPATRLQIAEEARRTLQDWPLRNFNYRADDVRQVVGLLDEVIGELRAASGAASFDLTFVATTDAPPPVPLLPPPTLSESIQQALTVSRMTESPAERLALLQSASELLNGPSETVPTPWLTAARDSVAREIAVELSTERSYAAFSRTTMAQATARAAKADVNGVERLLRQIPRRDAQLGGRRPEVVEALVRAVENKLDAARRLRLARDQWTVRRSAYRTYRRETRQPLNALAQAKPVLDDIKTLAGPDLTALQVFEERIAKSIAVLGGVVPPDDLRPIHALIGSALQFANNAARLRRQAIVAGNMSAAWDASSSAAAAMMLFARAQQELLGALKEPALGQP